MNVLMLTSTLPRHFEDLQANFVGDQASAWAAERPDDRLVILAPHHADASLTEERGHFVIHRYRYAWPAGLQRLAYPAILPNLRRNPMLYLQVPPFLVSQYLAAKRTVRSSNIDLVYAHWVLPQGLIAWQLARACGVPYILQNHSSDLTVFERLGSLGRNVARAVLKDSAHFFCVNADQRDYAAGLFKGAEREAFLARCTVLPMGITQPPPDVRSMRRTDLSTIGRLSRKKGIDLLILALEILARRDVRPSVLIAGDGEERTALEAMVDRANVRFTGFLTGEDKARFLAQSRCFAFPARAERGDVEGLPVALLEALARGAPVLASRDTNIHLLPEWEAIRDSVVFVEDPADVEALADAIEALLSRTVDPRTARIMQRYYWENLIREYLGRIDAALDHAGFPATSR